MQSVSIKRTELKLTNVARARLEELRLDYEDFLRQRNFPLWGPEHPSLKRFKASRCSSIADLRKWLVNEKNTDKDGHAQTNTNQKKTGKMSLRVSESPCEFVPDSVLVANASLSLLNLCCYLLDRQLSTQAEAFEKEGGFTERMYRIRTQRRRTK